MYSILRYGIKFGIAQTGLSQPNIGLYGEKSTSKEQEINKRQENTYNSKIVVQILMISGVAVNACSHVEWMLLFVKEK